MKDDAINGEAGSGAGGETAPGTPQRRKPILKQIFQIGFL